MRGVVLLGFRNHSKPLTSDTCSNRLWIVFPTLIVLTLGADLVRLLRNEARGVNTTKSQKGGNGVKYRAE